MLRALGIGTVSWPDVSVLQTRNEIVTYSRYMYVVFVVTALLAGWALKAAAISILLMTPTAEDMVLAGVLPLSTLIGFVGGGLTFFGLLRSKRAVAYVNEVIGEMVKVTWPTREETTNNALTVVVVTVIFSGSLAIFDLIWSKVTDLVFLNIG